MTQAKSLKASVVEWISEAFPSLFYGVPRSYVVTSVSGSGLLELAPPPSSPNLPPLANVPVWSLGGATVKPQAGALVVVLYLDVAAAPVAVGLAPSLPTATTIDAATMAIGPSASDVAIAGGSVVVAAGVEVGRVLRYGDVIAGPVAFGVPLTIAAPVPGTTPVSKVKA